MMRNRALVRAGRAVLAAVALAVLATGCAHSPDRAAPTASSAPSNVPGQVDVQADGVDLRITDAVAHLDASGSGTLTMTIHHGSGVPEHLDMVATPQAGRGTLQGAAKGDDGAMTDAGILLPENTTVTFGASGSGGSGDGNGSGNGPSIRLTRVQGVTAAHTLPLQLEFGVARLVRLSARVSPS
jgi:hypothetical protein